MTRREPERILRSSGATDDFFSSSTEKNEVDDDNYFASSLEDASINDDDDGDSVVPSNSPFSPRAATTLPLPLGDMNLMVLTDVHSWISGHERHESSMNADYGDILSLYRRLKDEIRRKYRKDFFMVMNGDFMDGTGLSTTPPQYLTPLLATMPFAIINLGNHELYHEETVEWIRTQFIPHWRGHYLTSNTLLRSTREPLGSRYVFLEGSHSTLLSFGFLFNFEGNCKTTIVEKVEDVVQQDWFLSVLARVDAYDAILVMAHMHVTDPLVEVIRLAIRQVVGPSVSIQFITGHTHIRAYAQLDGHAASFEAGRFLDTIGFCSFPTKTFHPIDDQSGNHELATPSPNSTISSSDDSEFQHVFIEPNRKSLRQVLVSTHNAVGGGDSRPKLDSSPGLILSRRIFEQRKQLGLLTTVGCSPSDFELELGLNESNSLWRLYMQDIVPTILFGKNNNTAASRNDTESIPLFLQGTGAFRYKLFQGRVLQDDVIAVCPFNDTIYQVTTNRHVTGVELLKILNISTHYPNKPHDATQQLSPKYDALPYVAVSTMDRIDDHRNYALFTSQFHVADLTNRIQNVLRMPIPDPQPVQSNLAQPGEYWTTTNLWKTFIEQEWQCTAKELHRIQEEDIRHRHNGDRPRITREERPMTVVIFIFLLVMGLYIYQKRKEHLARAGYMPIGDPTTALIRSSSRHQWQTNM